MNADDTLRFLAAYSLQLGLVLGAGMLLPAMLGLRQPNVSLRYWQLLLAGALILPLVAAVPLFDGSATQSSAGTVLVEEVVAAGTTQIGAWPLSRLLVLVLATGAVVRIAWLALGLWGLGRQENRAQELAPLPAAVLDAQNVVGCQANFRISQRHVGPLTFGWLHPKVLVPSGFSSLSDDAQRALACHELLHVRRGDWLHCLAEETIRTLFWFHPAVWMTLRRLALSREQVIDQEVVHLTGKRRVYLEALFEMAQSPRPRLSPLGASFLGRSELEQRITAMSKELAMSKIRLAATLAAITAVLAMIGVGAALSLPLSGTPSETGSEPIHVEGDVEKPVKISAIPPEYTEIARKEKTQGQVIVQTVIDQNGDVTEIEVLQGLPNGLTEAAVAAIEQWKFEPATLHGEAVSVYYNLTVNFRLE